MRKFGLVGYPLGHSFSQKYFSEKFSKEGISDCIYENFPVEDIDNLPVLIDENKELAGFNVTIPHKKNIIRFLTDIDPEAERTGAVNVVKVKRSGDKVRLKGFNSDIWGFRVSLTRSLRPGSYKALILGTGGSSLAVRHVLNQLGIQYCSVSRSHSGNNLAYGEINAGILKEHNLIINTTPLGMYPETDKCPDIEYKSLTPDHILFDLVYNPEITLFLKKGMEKSCSVKGGLEMLHLQAERSWEIWNDPLL